MPAAPVCAIVLNYNAMALTLACLDSLLGQVVVPDTIIVCDNGSSAEVPEKLRAWAEQNSRDFFESELQDTSAKTALTGKTVLIQNRANLGYAGGNNPGIRYALQQKFKYIWILNNDTLVKPDSLQKLMQCAEAQPGAGVFGSTVVFADQPDTVQCAGGCAYNPVTTVFRPAHGGRLLDDVLQTREIPRLDYVFGAALFVRAEVFEKCGLLTEDYFLFYEEIDLCKRALQAGYQLAWCRESIVFHKGSASVGQPGSGDRKKRAFANYHENLSTLVFTKRFYPCLLPAVLAFRFFGKLSMIGARGEWYLARPLLQAYRDFWRRRNQRARYGG